ncbi:hypothetical protein ACR80S_03895 [Halomonas sp. MA07-2]|uniref:hypothetical protein n=1 Tax=unclassified Halomonas TaxID=2609666 RepID=UPI003EEF9048
MKHLKRSVEKTREAEQYSAKTPLSASLLYLRGQSGVLGCQVAPFFGRSLLCGDGRRKINPCANRNDGVNNGS